MKALLLSAAAVFATPACAQVPSSGAVKTAELLSIGDFDPALSMTLVVPFERLLREHAADVELAGVETVPGYYNGGLFRFRLPQRAGPEGAEAPAGSTAPRHRHSGQLSSEPFPRAPARALETRDGFFLMMPEEPALFDAFERLARDPDAYRRPMQPRVDRRVASYGRVESPEGMVDFVTIETPRRAAAQWRKTLVTAYRLRAGGRAVDAVFIQKMTGGLAKLASALQGVRVPGVPALVVSRGTSVRRDSATTLEGRALLDALEGLGLKVSGVGFGELRRFEEVQRYLRERPDGIRFLSANVVVATAPATTVFPAALVIEAGGVRFGFLGLTNPRLARFMVAGTLKGLAVADPARAALEAVRRLRDQADVVVALSNLDESENARVRDTARGIDAIVSAEEPFLLDADEPRTAVASEAGRGPYSAVLLTASEFASSVHRLRFEVGSTDPAGRRSMRVSESHLPLDESLPDHEGFPEFEADEFGVSVDTCPPLLPAGRRLFPDGNPNASSRLAILGSRDFWTAAASLMAARTRSEAGLLPVTGIHVRTTGDVSEGELKDWFPWDQRLVTFELAGSDLLGVLAEVRAQRDREGRGIPLPEGRLRAAAGGFGAGDTVHGVPIDPGSVYRIAGTDLLLGNADSVPALARARSVEPVGDLQTEVLAELRRRAAQRWEPAEYRRMIEGRPAAETPLWTLNFRDIGLNFSNTKVVKDPDAFSRVANARVQGFDQQVIGLTMKLELDYQFRENRWANSLQVEYSRARLRPPNQAEIVNTPSNRISLLTLGTRRIGSFPVSGLARSYGPSLGFQYDGEVEKTPGLKRKNIFSLLPGIELFDGSWLRSVQLSGNLKRDDSRAPTNDQYGLRARVLAARPVRLARGGEATLQGEVWADYFVLTRRDTGQDLRLEGDANLKLHVPLWKSLTLSPFIDFYWFELKTRPVTGYSAMTGVSLGFSRLWKPQYEKF